MSHNFDHSNFEDRLRFKVNLVVPEFTAQSNYDNWALILSEQNTWEDDSKVSDLKSIGGQDRHFINAFLQLSRLLLELGRLPIFDIPRVVSLSQDKQNPKKYLLEIEFFLVPFVAQTAYQISIKASLGLCRWMAQNAPTLESKNKVFSTVTEKVIKPLYRLIPAGKSTIPVLRVAHALGIPFTHLGLGIYQLGWGSKARRLDRSTCELDSAIGSRLAQNKVLTANILRIAGLPSPVHSIVTTEDEALAEAYKIGFPVVIKPTDRDRGEGVTVDVSGESVLRVAFKHALKLSKSKQVIVERQVSGVCHRIFIANNGLLYAVKRHPMSVIGDGKKTIQQLVDDAVIEQGNKPPWSRSEIKPIDSLALDILAALGLSVESIPSKDEMIPLRRIESTEWGGIDEEVTAVVHPENLKIALQAAKLFGLHIAGIDIISPDITKPWYANGAIVNEVNFAPLFGGAEISRSHIPAFFARFLPKDGKIPIEVFDAKELALDFQKEQIRQGKHCFITSSEKTLDNLGNEIVMTFKNIKERVRALILRSDVDVIAIVQANKKAL
jgi:cyanophycin synthetase